jgi:metal-responsive CopG/Arc/MetJ family transcriptional regulator
MAVSWISIFKGVGNMASKTGIPLNGALLERVDVVASETGLSRSKPFALAMRRHLDRCEHLRIPGAR